MAFSEQGIQKGLMAGAAMMAGTAAASPRLGGSGHELGPALETEGGDFLGYLAAAALGALNLGLIVEDDLLKVLVAFGTMVFEDGHSQTPFLFHYNKGVGRKATANPFKETTVQGTGFIAVSSRSWQVAGCSSQVPFCTFKPGTRNQ
jgi:hypothetical protein